MTNITKTQLDSLISTNELIKGKTYEISGCHTSLFGGTTIIVKAIETNRLEYYGTGIFYTPNYDQNAQGFGIFDPTISVEIGTKTIYGGFVWENVSGEIGSAIDVLNLNEDWQKVPYNEIDYSVSYDVIGYDYENDLITYRLDKQGQFVKYSIDDLDYFSDYYGILINPIAVVQWGNYASHLAQRGTRVENNNSYIETVNFKGSYINNAIFNKGSYMYNNTFKIGVVLNNLHSNINGGFVDCEFKENSYLNNVVLYQGSQIAQTIVGENTGINFLNIDIASSFSITVPDNKIIQNVIWKGVTKNEDLTNATVIYANDLKTVFCTPDKDTKISRYDNNANEIISNILD